MYHILIEKNFEKTYPKSFHYDIVDDEKEYKDDRPDF